MPRLTGTIRKDTGDLRVVAYPGDNTVLLAMSLADTAVDNLAGFAIWRTAGGKPEEPLSNRLSFDIAVTADTTPQQRKWTPSPEAPFQKFRWVDVPPFEFDADITYRVMAKYFTGTGKALRDGPEATVTISPPQLVHSNFRIAFTRGYASSQAYADKFHNAPIRPAGPKTPDFDTTPYVKSGQYEWLGASARRQVFKFLDECTKDTSCKVDVLAYDLDEPDVVKTICAFGKRARAILDNAPLHMPTKKGDNPPEVKAAQLVTTALGAANVKRGHFSRYQHNKVFIKRDSGGKAQKVLFGSMNFSVRGIYVQANNVLVVDDAKTAQYFADAFDNAFENATATNVSTSKFEKAPFAKTYNTISAANSATLPQSAVALSPHADATQSLAAVSASIRAAKSSVLFAVMEPTGSGPVLDSLRDIAAQPIIFSYGTVQTDAGLAVQDSNGAMGDVVPFDYLKDKVPPPFTEEWSGKGPGEKGGMTIHHKFVVVDFNGDKPTVFTGSSNLSKGGEEANGDNLIRIDDPVVAGLYAIEAVRLFDHYSFRKAMRNATHVQPLSLWYPGKPNAPTPWYKPYYDKQSIKLRDRCLFAEEPLPPGVQPVKDVDWASLDKLAAAAAKKQAQARKNKTAAKAKKPSGKPKPAGKKTVKKKKPVAKKKKKKTAATRKRKARR